MYIYFFCIALFHELDIFVDCSHNIQFGFILYITLDNILMRNRNNKKKKIFETKRTENESQHFVCRLRLIFWIEQKLFSEYEEDIFAWGMKKLEYNA